MASEPFQYDIQDLEAWLSSELPFETAKEAYKRATGDSLSNGHMHDTANKVAECVDITDVCPTKVEIEQTINEIAENSFRRPVMSQRIVSRVSSCFDSSLRSGFR